MKGYLINFYKYLPGYNYSEANYEDINKSVVWSSFDRITVEEIGEFKEYRTLREHAMHWNGERQFTMLYELNPNESNLNYIKQNNTSSCKFPFFIKNSEESKRFYGITFIHFSPEIIKNIYTPSGRSRVYHAVNSLVTQYKEKNDDIQYEIFGVLGGQDIVIIWLANQFTDISQAARYLRAATTMSNKNAIASIYTMVGLSDANNESIDYSDVTGKIRVKLTKKDSFTLHAFKKILEDKKYSADIRFIFGKYDIEIELKNNNIIKELYKKDGLLNPKSSVFKQFFLQSKTEIIIEDSKIYNAPLFEIDSVLSKKENINNTITIDLEKLIEEIVNSESIKKADYLKETIWILYEDYLRCSNSSFSYPWTRDLDFQFTKSLDFLNRALKDEKLTAEDKYDNIRRVVDNLHMLMVHISQANKIFVDMPNTHLKHTGAYSKILHCYYGVVKQYLSLAYSIPRYDKQSYIIPFLSFDTTPIIESDFCDNLSEKYEEDTYKIIRIKMPYAALVEIEKYKNLLAHEVYHYIAPADRAKRNMLTFRISLALLLGELSWIYVGERIFPSFLKENELKNSEEDLILLQISKAVQKKILEMKEEKLEEILYTWIPQIQINNEWKAFNQELNIAIMEQMGDKDGILHILKNQLNTLEVDAFTNGDQNKLAEIIKLLRETGAEQLKEWKLFNKPNHIIALSFDIKYSLREAMADYFMIQTVNMSICEYAKNIYNAHLQMEDGSSMHLTQFHRVALVLNQLLPANTYADNLTIEDLANNAFRNIARSEHVDVQDKGLIDSLYVICNAYAEFIHAYADFRPFFWACFESLKFDEIKKNSSIFEEELTKTRKLIEFDFKNEFKSSIEMIERFQDQPLLEELKIKEYINNKEKYRTPTLNNDKITVQLSKKKTLTASSFFDIFTLIQNAKNEIIDNPDELIWYRGQVSKEYHLIPSVYRMKDKKTKFYKDVRLRHIMTSLMDNFRAKAYNAPELYIKNDSSEISGLINMQHYGTPTNILDWSPSLETAIYFALEPEIDPKKKICDEDAAIYLLNPIRLNNARNIMMRGNNPTEYPIPALIEKSEIYKDYIPAREYYHNSISEKNAQYPLAIYTPYTNVRITGQKGTFVAFGLDNIGKIDETGTAIDFKELSLLNFQKDYEKFCQSFSEEYRPFITAIYIDKNKKQEISKQMQAIGISKINIYPELSNISEDIQKEVDSYYNLKK